MDLEIFEHIGDVLDVYESKKDVYKLIAEDVEDFFEKTVFPESEYEFSMVYRIKTAESIREKLIRNNYIIKKGKSEEILAAFQDILGFRIECKFIDEEEYAFRMLKECFSMTEDGQYYYMRSMPKIRLDLSSKQPQTQKNGFDLYKIDGLYMLGKESIRFELQIKALVNVFWGEIEHRVVYKNNDYLLADSFVSDLLVSIKKSLNMIDSQLYVLYKRFKTEHVLSDGEAREAKARSIEIFVANMVYDTFDSILMEQMGFSIDFKQSCDAVVRYIMNSNKAEDMEDYGRVMLFVFNALNDVRAHVRLDEQIEFERRLYFEDVFSGNLLETVQKLVNINYRWHMYFAILFSLEKGEKADVLENFVRFLRDDILRRSALAILQDAKIKNAAHVRVDILNAVSEVIRKDKRLEYFFESGIQFLYGALDAVVPAIAEALSRGEDWEEIKEAHIGLLQDKMRI